MVLTIILSILFTVFTIRLFYLQVLEGTTFKSRAQQNQTKALRIPSYRSIIYDRNKNLKLAYNKRSLVLTVIEANLPKQNTLQRVYQIQQMANILQTTPKVLCTTIKEQKIDSYTPIIIQDDASIDTISRFAEKIDDFPGVFWENQPKRVYPFAESGFHVVGYTGLLNKDEYEQYKNVDEYYLGTSIGKRGIEKQYDNTIRGKSGTLIRSVNAMGQVLQQDVSKEAIQSEHLVLTIDARLQQKAYDLLKEFTGAVIISHVTTGEILTLVSTPSIDPTVFNNTKESLKRFNALVLDPKHPFLNRVIQGTYPPASTFKIISSAAFLKNGIDPKQKLHTMGSYTIGDRTFKDWRNQGIVNGVRDAIAASANVYYYHYSQTIGRKNIFDMAREFGLTTPYGIDLPDEKAGFMPNDQWFKQTHERPWSLGDTANIAIGQGDVLTTPLEINMMTSIIANKGTIYKPYILKEKLRIRDKATIWKQTPTPLKILNLSPDIFTEIQEGMYFGVTNKRGTSSWLTRYNIIRVPIAGKTGTAQTGLTRFNNGLYTAYGPYGKENLDNTIAITVLLEQARTGNAVRIVAELFNYYFNTLYPEKNSKKETDNERLVQK